MEEEEHEEHLNEPEPPEPSIDDAGTSFQATAGVVRFYECIFCKRGFSTAQALGGHMNIHRRDRAKIRPSRSSTPAPKRAEETHHPYSREQRRLQSQAVESTSSNYAVYCPGEEMRKEKGKDQVDLELRLGHGRGKEHESS